MTALNLAAAIRTAYATLANPSLDAAAARQRTLIYLDGVLGLINMEEQIMDTTMTAMSKDKIDALNALLTPDKTVHDVATEAGLTLVRWHDESGGLYRDSDGAHVFGWELSPAGFDDQIENVYEYD